MIRFALRIAGMAAVLGLGFMAGGCDNGQEEEASLEERRFSEVGELDTRLEGRWVRLDREGRPKVGGVLPPPAAPEYVAGQALEQVGRSQYAGNVGEMERGF